MPDDLDHQPAITRPQLRKLMAGFAGVDRDTRLQRISILAARRVTTARDLTIGEASLIIDTLEREALAPAW